jgi:hypothetical protein
MWSRSPSIRRLKVDDSRWRPAQVRRSRSPPLRGECLTPRPERPQDDDGGVTSRDKARPKGGSRGGRLSVTCGVCGTSFGAQRSTARYCSDARRKAAQRERPSTPGPVRSVA